MNHVVYFGDGVSPQDRAARLQDHQAPANFTSGIGEKSPIESDEIRKTTFFYTDGGGIKSLRAILSDRSSASRCSAITRARAAAACRSSTWAVIAGIGALPDCIFRDNRTQTTGSAVDLLHGSHATIENCLFVGNVANMGVDVVGLLGGGRVSDRNTDPAR